MSFSDSMMLKTDMRVCDSHLESSVIEVYLPIVSALRLVYLTNRNDELP